MLILVRHGRTAANADGRLLGRLDPELDEVGLAQADALAGVLCDVSARSTSNPGSQMRIVSSPLRRSRATAEAIGAAAGVGVEIDDRWIELDYGEFDGVPIREVPAESWATWRGDPRFAPPGGESLEALGLRVRSAIIELAEEASAADIVVVSHVSPIKAAVAWALGVGDETAWRMFLSPASISSVAISDRGPALHQFNVTSHLSP